MPPSSSQAWVNAYFMGSKKRVGVYLRFTKEEYGTLLFQKLLEDKEAISSELDEKVEWDIEADGGYPTIYIRKDVDDVWADKNRKDIKEFFSKNINDYVKHFANDLRILWITWKVNSLTVSELS